MRSNRCLLCVLFLVAWLAPDPVSAHRKGGYGGRPPTGPPVQVPVPVPTPRPIFPGLPPGVGQAIMGALPRSRGSIPTMGAPSDEQLMAEWHEELRRAQRDLDSHDSANRIIKIIKYGGSLVATGVGFVVAGPGGAVLAGVVFRTSEGTTEVYVRTGDGERTAREVVYQGLGEAAGVATGNPFAGFVVRGATKAGTRQLGEADLRGLFEDEQRRTDVRRRAGSTNARAGSTSSRTESTHPGFGPSSPAGWRGPTK